MTNKKYLAGISAIAAAGVLSLGVSAAHADVTLPSTTTDTVTNSVTAEAVDFAAFDGTVDVDDGALVGAVTIGAANAGTLDFAGDSTVSGDIGTASELLKELVAGEDAKLVTFKGDVFATTITLKGTGDITFGDGTTAATVEGAITFNDEEADINIEDGVTIGGTIESGGANDKGELFIKGSATFEDTIGAANEIGAISIEGDNTETVAFEATIDALSLTFDAASDALIKVSDDANITLNSTLATADNGEGAIEFVGSSTVAAGIGATGKNLRTVTINSGDTTEETVTITAGGLFADSVVFKDVAAAVGSTLVIGDGNVVAPITVTTTDTNTVQVDSDTNSFTGVVGTSAASRLLNLDIATNDGETTTFNNDVFTKGIDVTDTGTARFLGVVGVGEDDLAFTADGVIEVADGQTLAFDITSDGDNKGTLTFDETNATYAVTGTIGTSDVLDLKVINAGASGSTSTFSGAVFANALTFLGDGTVVLAADATVATTTLTTNSTLTINDAVDVTGAIDADVAGRGDINFAGATTVTGAVGATGVANINFTGTKTVTFQETIDTVDMTFTGDATAQFADGKTVVVDNGIKTTGDGVGNLIFDGTTTIATDIGESALLDLNTISIAGANDKTVTLSNVFAETINIANGGNLTIATDGDVIGNITTSTADTGLLTFGGADSSTMFGNIGATAALENIIVATTGADVATFTGTVASKSFDITAAGVTAFQDNVTIGADGLTITADATINVSAGKSITGVITTDADQGIINFAGSTTVSNTIGDTTFRLDEINFLAGTAILKATIFTADMDIAGNATVSLDSSSFTDDTIADLNSSITIAGTLNLGENTVTLPDTADDPTLTLSSGGNIQLTLTDSDTFGSITAEVVTLAADGTITIDVAGAVDNGDTFDIIVEDTAGDAEAIGGALPTTITSTNDFYTFTAALVDANDDDADDDLTTGNTEALRITAVREDLNTFAPAGDTRASATLTAIDAIVTTDAQLLAARTAVLTGGSANAATNADKTNPEYNNSNAATAFDVASNISNTVGNRLGNLRVASNGHSGVAAGGMSATKGAWGQIFGNNADQGDREGVNGYQAKTWGLAFGFDSALDDANTVGISLAYATSEIESSRADVDVDTMQVSAYGSHSEDNWYVDGLLGYGINDYSSVRKSNAVGVNNSNGSFDGATFTAKAEAGYTLESVPGPLQVTPSIGAQYFHNEQDNYTETGGAANTVASDDLSKFESIVGLDLAYPMAFNGVTYTPELRARWLYDFVADEASVAAGFAASTVLATRTLKGASVAENTFELGIGLDVVTQDNLTVSLDYDLTEREDFQAHTGVINARYEF